MHEDQVHKYQNLIRNFFSLCVKMDSFCTSDALLQDTGLERGWAFSYHTEIGYDVI